MHPILQRFSASRRIVGIELIVGGVDWRAHLVVLRRKGSAMEVELVHTDLQDENELNKLIPQSTPVVAVLSGKGILHRTVETVANTDSSSLIHKVLPNAITADFWVHRVEAVGGRKIISVVRKSVADEQLKRLHELGISIVACSLGAAAVAEVLPVLINDLENTISIGMHQLRFEEGQVADMLVTEERTTKQTLDIGGKPVPLAAIGAFAAALQHYTGRGTARITAVELQTAANDFDQHRLFRWSGLVLLSALLILLIGNALLFSSYWEKKNKLEEQLQVNGGMLEQVRILEKQVSARREFLMQSGMQQADRHSFFADRLANGLPGALTLTRLAIDPRERTTVEDSIAFRPGVIVLEGECSRSIELNNWIGRLNTEPWITKASLISYQQPNSKKTGLFEVEIQLSE
jgi:Tfp pilus assembly protein PilN